MAGKSYSSLDDDTISLASGEYLATLSLGHNLSNLLWDYQGTSQKAERHRTSSKAIRKVKKGELGDE